MHASTSSWPWRSAGCWTSTTDCNVWEARLGVAVPSPTLVTERRCSAVFRWRAKTFSGGSEHGKPSLFNFHTYKLLIVSLLVRWQGQYSGRGERFRQRRSGNHIRRGLHNVHLDEQKPRAGLGSDMGRRPRIRRLQVRGNLPSHQPPKLISCYVITIHLWDVRALVRGACVDWL